MLRHEDTFLTLEQLGSTSPPYQPTYHYNGQYLNEHHQFYSICPTDDFCIQIGIKGWLQPADALKIYELAYFSQGDILELGCHQGLSASILSQANKDNGNKKYIITNDIQENFLHIAANNLEERKLSNKISYHLGDAAELCRTLAKEGRSFDLVFIDHDHSYSAVLDVCNELRKIVNTGGMCLFHDYNTIRNLNDENKDYAVYQAVHDGLPTTEFDFYGIYGCTGLFRKK